MLHLMGLTFSVTGLDPETHTHLRQAYPWYNQRGYPQGETKTGADVALAIHPGATPGRLRAGLSPHVTLAELFPQEFAFRFQRQGRRLVDTVSQLAFWNDGRSVWAEGRLRTALEVLLFHLALLHRRRAGGNPIVLHGGGVVFPEIQCALVLAGPSGVGKSTLTTALCQHGLAYLSDEVIVLDGHDILPYSRAIGLRQTPAVPYVIQDSARGEAKFLVRPDAFGAQRPKGHAQLGAVLVLEPHGDKMRMEMLKPMQAATRLMAHAYTGRQAPAALLMRLADLCRDIPCARLVPGMPHTTAAYLVDWGRSLTGAAPDTTSRP